MTRLLPAATAAWALAAAAAITNAQPGQPSQTPPQPTFRIEANFVRVDAYPTASGAPVKDLTREEFEVYEDGVLQRIETFEHIIVRPAGPQETRREPASVREANAAAAEPRNRVFVLFLDTYHVENEASRRVRDPLIRILDVAIGQDDLVAVMTPEMSAGDISFARKRTTIEGILTRHWFWGRREDINQRDPEEEKYEACYINVWPPGSGLLIVKEMSLRRRERRTLDALQDLVRHLRGVREERKAILLVSDGWALFRPNHDLAKALRWSPTSDPVVPGPPEIGVGPGGRIRSGPDARDPSLVSMHECDRDRLFLAQLDNDQLFRDILGEANRANATVYPIDPRGLPAFDTPIGPDPPLPPAADQAQLTNRIDTLRTLAGATDGVAVVNSNDIEEGIRRIVDDLTSYYLLGYYSTNGKLDGKFRSIDVRVKRPGVAVRARRGYRAATPEEVSAGAAAPEPAPAGEGAAVSAALAALGAVRADVPFRVRAVGHGRRLWIAGELSATLARAPEWTAGGEASVLVVGASGDTLGSARATLAAGGQPFLTVVALPESAVAQECRVQVRLRAAGGGTPLMETVAVTLDATPEALALGLPVLFRRGPATGSSFMATADVRFRRTERLRVESPATDGGEASIRVLDRGGKALTLPSSLGERRDDGVRWIQGEIGLAPLAPGDYVVELSLRVSDALQRRLVAFRVVP